jgi:acetylornithine/succinyldiaminopimelate/putrescine aminotransferase
MSTAKFVSVERSLTDILGSEYIKSISAARAFFDGEKNADYAALADKKVSFFPETMQAQMTSLLGRVGAQVIENPLTRTAAGAGTAKFREATKVSRAPLNGLGYFCVGEDGKLYLITKSEHYHAPLGHSFPGYSLINNARELGIPNATHNNTRGYITRLLEEELIRTANGLRRGDRAGLDGVLNRKDDIRVLNRVLNLETGSLAVEAALKMILARFHQMQDDMPQPKYKGRVPVVLVMGNDDAGMQANYHGTTVLTQMMRGIWPGLYSAMEKAGLWKVVMIRPNSIEDIDRAFAEYEQGESKIAGFFHEIVMMNYGGRLLTKEFLSHAYELCDRHDVPTVVDEIQSCMWAPQLYLFREYGLSPTFVAIGKGFPGGEYPASRILFSSAMDVMPQFGALVTNGQEELASLAYLITMEWAQANSKATGKLGSYYSESLRDFAEKHSDVIVDTDGWNHMTTLRFSDLNTARSFAAALNKRGLDISAQTYKADCPPVVLTKLPLIADAAVIDFVLNQMEEVMQELSSR